MYKRDKYYATRKTAAIMAGIAPSKLCPVCGKQRADTMIVLCERHYDIWQSFYRDEEKRKRRAYKRLDYLLSQYWNEDAKSQV